MSSTLFGSGPDMPNYGEGPRTGYSVENPTDWNPNAQYNTGIGADWFKDMSKWKSVKDGTIGYDPNSLKGLSVWLPGQEGQAYNPEWVKQMGAASDGYMYRGDDGKRYIIDQTGGPLYRGQGAIDPESSMTGAMPGKTPYGDGYSVKALHQGNERIGYNGIPHDMYDANGKYLNTELPQGLGHDKFWRDAAILAAMVATAGIGGAYGAGTLGSTTGTTAGLGEGALAASGNFGVNAGTAGAAGANAASVGGSAASMGYNPNVSGSDLSTYYGDYGSTGGTGTVGADYGVGGASGAGSLGGGGSGAPVTDLSSYGSGSLTQSGGGWDSLLKGFTGSGSMSSNDLLKLAMTAYGAYSGSQPQEQTVTSTKELPEWLKGPVYGQGGVIPQTQWLMNQQTNGTGLLAQKAVKKSAKQEKDRKRGLL